VQFLFRLYADTRSNEMARWGWDEKQEAAFLDSQFKAQSEHYRETYPDADSQIILANENPVGKMLVNWGAHEVTLVDIAILREYCGRGLGTRLLTELLKRAAREEKAVRLHVLKSSPARRLYERLGFATVTDDGLYLGMFYGAPVHQT